MKLTSKKLLSLLLVLCLGLATVFCLVACDEEDNIEKSSVPLDIDLLSLSDQLAYAQTIEIWHKPNAFTGKVIRIKGIYTKEKLNGSSQKYNFINVSDGCNCGNYAYVTFVYDGDLPSENTEVVAIGTIRTMKKGDAKFPEIVVEQIKF